MGYAVRQIKAIHIPAVFFLQRKIHARMKVYSPPVFIKAAANMHTFLTLKLILQNSIYQ